MTDAITQAKEAIIAASTAERAVRYELSVAVRALEDSFEARIRTAERAVQNAQKALDDAKNAATPDHEWEGKIVVRQQPIYASGRFARQIGVETVRGIVKTLRPGMQVSGSFQVKNATIGTVLVFDIKKDGTRALRAELFADYKQWSLAPVQAKA
jgi:hypothetical protein